jgi:hypothetical protein
MYTMMFREQSLTTIFYFQFDPVHLCSLQQLTIKSARRFEAVMIQGRSIEIARRGRMHSLHDPA